MNPKIRMIALRAQYYDRDLKAGDTFETTPEHAALLERTGAARREPTSKREYKRRDMKAED